MTFPLNWIEKANKIKKANQEQLAEEALVLKAREKLELEQKEAMTLENTC